MVFDKGLQKLSRVQAACSAFLVNLLEISLLVKSQNRVSNMGEEKPRFVLVPVFHIPW